MQAPVFGGGAGLHPDPTGGPSPSATPFVSGCTSVRDPASGIPVRTDLGAV